MVKTCRARYDSPHLPRPRRGKDRLRPNADERRGRFGVARFLGRLPCEARAHRRRQMPSQRGSFFLKRFVKEYVHTCGETVAKARPAPKSFRADTFPSNADGAESHPCRRPAATRQRGYNGGAYRKLILLLDMAFRGGYRPVSSLTRERFGLTRMELALWLRSLDSPRIPGLGFAEPPLHRLW